MEISTPRKRKSEPLTKDELKSLQKFVSQFHTVIDASEALGISRQTLDRVLVIGKGSPETVSRIKENLPAA